MDDRALVSASLVARADLWSSIAAGFTDPFHRDRLALLASGGFRERCRRGAALLAEEASGMELGPGEARPADARPEEVFEAFDAERPSLRTSYRKLFGLTALSLSCPACESEYLPSPDVNYRSQWMADAAGFYRAFGMDLASGRSERCDHVVTEAEFLHLLLLQEAHARLKRDWEGAAISSQARRKFFAEHVGWWVPALARLVTKRTSSRFYRALARLAAGACALERSCLELPPFPKCAEPRPSETEPTGTCFECQGAAPSA